MMKHKALSALIAVAMLGGGITSAYAQDGNWYIAPRVGANFSDSNRKTDTSLYTGLGIGWWVSPNFAVDAEYAINNADFKNNSFRAGHEWESVSLGVTGRWFFGDQGSAWRPYVLGGLGAVRHAAYSGTIQHNGWDPMATVGGGIEYNFNERMALRGEIAARYDHDNNSLRGQFPGAGDHNHYVDGIVSVGLTIAMGSQPAPEPAPAAAPPPPPPPEAAPEEPAATPVVIDLRGVNFKFDRPRSNETDITGSLQEPTADSIAILDQAVDVLSRNPNVRVELDGHTDSVGTEAYNQKLSERRAQIVYDYLTSHGVSSSQITGVKGFGESNPIDTNDTKEGRARNRRTELAVDGQ
ncbi:MAG TPA: OmpA family protein [Dokdonella sp.]|uniref:OmpA family protein n=1 Tax=Dokdonella sp. TaxID=2291710 RepID=UPI002D7F7CCB|nr:OmpA family protein [Dokdonella sp.]HET9033465.1 OmpA family protein [Dokdonella sp.]